MRTVSNNHSVWFVCYLLHGLDILCPGSVYLCGNAKMSTCHTFTVVLMLRVGGSIQRLLWLLVDLDLTLRLVVRYATHVRRAHWSLRTKTNLEVLQELSCLLIDVCAERYRGTALYRATFGEDRGQINIVGVDLEWLLALTVVDTIHGHGDEAVAR